MTKEISKILVICIVLEGVITYINSFIVLANATVSNGA